MWQEIKLARKALGFKQMQVAVEAGVSLATLQNIEAGKANPSYETLQAILGVLGLKLKIQPHSITPENLASLGVPVVVEQISPMSFTSAAEFRAQLKSIRPELFEDEKVKKAFVSYLIALKDHYPDFWQTIQVQFAPWLKENDHLLSIKLRRISLAQLGEIL